MTPYSLHIRMRFIFVRIKDKPIGSLSVRKEDICFSPFLEKKIVFLPYIPSSSTVNVYIESNHHSRFVPFTPFSIFIYYSFFKRRTETKHNAKY
jgi:hypothetical protein